MGTKWFQAPYRRSLAIGGDLGSGNVLADGHITEVPTFCFWIDQQVVTCLCLHAIVSVCLSHIMTDDVIFTFWYSKRVFQEVSDQYQSCILIPYTDMASSESRVGYPSFDGWSLHGNPSGIPLNPHDHACEMLWMDTRPGKHTKSYWKWPKK